MSKAKKGRPELFRRAEQAGARAVLSWVGHPAVAGVVEQWRAAAVLAIAPVDELLCDQVDICVAVAECLGIEGWRESGRGLSEDPERELEVRRAVAAAPAMARDLRHAIRGAATSMVTAGVLLDAGGREVLFVVGQLLLLDVDLAQPPRSIVDGLSILPTGGFDEAGRTLETSRHTNARGAEDLTGLQARYREAEGQGRIPLAYASGGQRGSRRSTQARRAALTAVLAKHPNVTAGAIQTTWRSSDDRTPGGQLRTLLGLRQDSVAPPVATLNEDLRKLRAQPAQ